jgi:hypothetical protein
MLQCPSIMVDGTFSLCESGLTLTTWMGASQAGVDIPVIFILSADRTTESYIHANKLIKSSAPRLSPDFFLVDLEPRA